MPSPSPSYQAEYYLKKKAAGLCVGCGHARDEGGTSTACAECRRIKALKSRNRYRHQKGLPTREVIA